LKPGKNETGPDPSSNKALKFKLFKFLITYIDNISLIFYPWPGISIIFPALRNFAFEIVFKSTALGLQLNLYRKELSAFSGAGTYKLILKKLMKYSSLIICMKNFFLQPPQYDLYDLITPPDSFISSNACIANI
jgi:hypothetical protein